jgi:hypothetical protein
MSAMSRQRSHAWARAAFTAALRLYPPSYREEYGREMTLVLVDRLRHIDGVRAIGVSASAILGVFLDAPREHGRILAEDLGSPRA